MKRKATKEKVPTDTVSIFIDGVKLIEVGSETVIIERRSESDGTDPSMSLRITTRRPRNPMP